MSSLEVIIYLSKQLTKSKNDTIFGALQLNFRIELPPIKFSCLKCRMREVKIARKPKS